MDTSDLRLIIAAIKEERERVREEEVEPLIKACQRVIAQIEAAFCRADQSSETQDAIDHANSVIDKVLAKT